MRPASIAALLAGALTAFATPARAAWPAFGTTLNAPTYATIGAQILPGPGGGWTVAFLQRSGAGMGWSDVMCTRVDANGDSLANGLVPSNPPGDFCPDSAGGIYRAAYYPSPTSGVYMSRWPLPGNWPGANVLLGTTSTNPLTIRCGTTSDGGCMVVWYRFPTIYASRLTPNGTVAAGWPAAGKLLGNGNPTTGDPARVIAGDSADGYIGWHASTGIKIARLTASGALGAGWPLGGVTLSSATTANAPPPAMIRLPGGDVLIAWKDAQGSSETFDPGPFYVQRVRPDGTLANGWPQGGIQIRGALDFDGAPELVGDGATGGFLVWARAFASGYGELRALHVLGDGSIATGWTAAGTVVTPANAVYVPDLVNSSTQTNNRNEWNFRVCASDDGGLFVGWDDVRNAGRSAVWIAHRDAAGAAGADWSPEGRAVSDTSRAAKLGGIAPDGPGDLLVAWHTSVPGAPPNQSAVARLSRVEPDAALAAPPPSAAGGLSLAIAGANPARGAFSLRCAVAGEMPARLDVFDLGGRRVATERVAPGTARLVRVPALAGGLYFARLACGSEARTIRVAVVR